MRLRSSACRTIRPSGCRPGSPRSLRSALAQLDLAMLLDLLRIEGAVGAVGSRSRRSQPRRPNAARSQATSPALTRCSKRWSARRTPMVAPHSAQLRRRPSNDWRRAQSPVTSGCTSARSIDSDVDRFNQLCQLLGAERRAVRWPTRSPEKRTPLPFDGSRAASQFRRRRPPVGRATEEFAESGRPAHGDRRCSGVPEARKRCSSWPRCWAMPTRRSSASPSTRSLKSGRPTPIPFCTGCCSKPIRHATARCGSCSASATTKRCRFSATSSTKGEPKGKLIGIHITMIEALGALRPRPESIRALQQVLLRGRWWAPFRASPQRHAAATSLRKLGTPEAAGRPRSRRQQRRPRRAQGSRGRSSRSFRNGRRARHECAAALSSRRRTLASPRGGDRGAQLYAPGHPLVTRSVTRAHRHARRCVHQSTPSVAIGIVGEELVVGDSPVPRAAETMSELMRRLQQLGIERIVIDKGVQEPRSSSSSAVVARGKAAIRPRRSGSCRISASAGSSSKSRSRPRAATSRRSGGCTTMR